MPVSSNENNPARCKQLVASSTQIPFLKYTYSRKGGNSAGVEGGVWRRKKKGPTLDSRWYNNESRSSYSFFSSFLLAAYATGDICYLYCDALLVDRFVLLFYFIV